MDDPLAALTIKKLRAITRAYQMKGRSKPTTKAALVAFLREHLTVDQIEKGAGGKKTPTQKSKTELFDLPQELIWETLYDLPPRDVLQFCATHRKAAEKICQNNDFWFEKIQRDFGELFDISTIPTENRLETYKQYWEDAQAKFVPCARRGHLECVESLLRIGVNSNTLNIYGITALMWASERGYPDIVRLLLEHGAKANIQNKSGFTALMRATRDGHADIVQLLLEYDADPDLQNAWGHTALTLAAREGHADIVQLLLERGADLNLQNMWGNTALMTADEERHTDIVRLLKSFE